jgi:hypothetical protein
MKTRSPDSPRPRTQMTDTEGVTHTSTVDTLMADLDVEPAQIGDMVEFCDDAGIKWRGVVLDIRRMATLLNGLLIREDQLDHIPDPTMRADAKFAPVEPWAFVACIAQPQTTAVRLTRCWPQDRGWWHCKPVKRQRPQTEKGR